MCWQALALAAIGSGIQYAANDAAKKNRDRELAANILKQSQANREAGLEVQQATQQIAQSNPDAERAAKRQTYIDALRRSASTRAGAMPDAGGASSRFRSDLAAAQDDADAEANNLADLTAEIEAPAYQRFKDGVGASNLATKLSLISGRSAGADYLSRLRTAMVRPNAGAVAAGQVIGGFGSGLASNGGWGDGGEENIWMDGTTSTGLTADQRRRKYYGG
jgi:hypothetical protein